MANQKRIKDIWKRKDDYITSRMDWLAKRVTKAQDDLFKLLMGDYIGNFSVDEAGNLKANVGNTRQVIVLDRIFDKLARETLIDLNTRFGEDMLKLIPISGKYYKEMGESKETVDNIASKTGFIDVGIGIKDGKIVEGGYLDTITRMPEARQELKDYITTSVANKKSFKEFIRGMKRIVLGASPGLLDRYYKQFAFDTFNQTDAAVNKKFADDLDLTWFVYSGSLIDTSRAFCIKRAGKTFNTEETEKWKCDPTLLGKPKGIKCDQSYNPLIERGRWNCRHTIRYISADLACNNGRKEACEGEITEPQAQAKAKELREVPKFNKAEDAENWARNNLISKEGLEAEARSKRIFDELVAKHGIERVKAPKKIVDYRGLSPDSFNLLNSNVKRLVDQGMPKLSTMRTKALRKEQWLMRMSDGGDLDINSVGMKTPSKIKETLDNARKLWDQAPETIKILEQNIEKLTTKEKWLLDYTKRMMQFKRPGATSNFTEVVNHELGHHFMNFGYKIRGVDRQVWRKTVNEALVQAMSEKYKFDISFYASASITDARFETFAEAFALYLRGNTADVPPQLLNLFKQYF